MATTRRTSVAVYRRQAQRSELPTDVTVYNPFERPKSGLANRSGRESGRWRWLSFRAADRVGRGKRHLPRAAAGQSPVLTLNYGRVTSGDPTAVKTLIELLGKRPKRLQRPWHGLRPQPKAILIILGTPKLPDSILYWKREEWSLGKKQSKGEWMIPRCTASKSVCGGQWAVCRKRFWTRAAPLAW